MNVKIGERIIDILLVEDDPDDAFLTAEALKDGRIRNKLHVVTDGAEALDFLRRRGAHADAPRPGLVLLDLNLPKISGHDVLRAIKNDPGLRMIPVVILTTSRASDDILKSYGLNGNCYIVKPVDLDQFIKAVKSIETFWLSIVELPPDVG